MRLSKRIQAFLAAAVAAGITTWMALPAAERHEQMFSPDDRSEPLPSAGPSDLR